VTDRLGIIADDYTGALMVACYLEAHQVYAPLVFDSSATVADADVIVAGARIRISSADEAVEQVGKFADAFAAAGYGRLMYKPSAGFDSTERGNIGPVADALADRQGARPVVMAAGFPEFNITTHQGYLFYRGRLVSESIKRSDPLTPMSDPDLVRFLSRQTPHGIGLISHIDMNCSLSELAARADALIAAGNGHLFFDLSDAGDIEIVTDFALERHSVIVASDPVAVRYATKLLRNQPSRKALPRQPTGSPAVLVGTVGPVIERQLGVFAKDHPVLYLDLLDARGNDAIIADALSWCADNAGRRSFAIATAKDESAVRQSQEAFGQIQAARKAEAILAAIARALHGQGIRRFVVAGGETSGAVVDALGIRAVRALPEGPIGTGFCVTETDDPISLFLKPGKHGRDDILTEVIRLMG
jgi:3-dehydrotetronate 4-kinase